METNFLAYTDLEVQAEVSFFQHLSGSPTNPKTTEANPTNPKWS